MQRLDRMLSGKGFRVVEAEGLRTAGHRVEVVTPEATLRLEPVGPAPVGFCKADITFSSPELSNATFEVQFGERGTERRRVLQLIHAGRGRYEGMFHLPEPVAAITLQPNAVGSWLGFDRFELGPLSAFDRLHRVVRRALSLLARNPFAFLSALRRFRAAQAQGDVVVVRLRDPLRKGQRYQQWLARFDDDPVTDAPLYRERLARTQGLPSFTALVRAGEDRAALEATLASVHAQLHGAWEVIVISEAGAARRNPAAGAPADEAVRWLACAPGQDPAQGLNAALAIARGDWILALPAGMRLRPHALAEIALAAALTPEARIIYSDEDRIDGAGRRTAPHFKPDWSPDLLRSWNYVGQLTAWGRDLVKAVGGWRPGFATAGDYDLTFRASEQIEPRDIRHIPKVLVHAPADLLHAPPGAAPVSDGAAARAVAEHLARTGRAASVRPAAGVMHVAYALPSPAPLVSIIIPTRDRVGILKLSVGSILERTTYPRFELIIVDNNSVEAETAAFLKLIAQDRRVRVLPYPGPFNFSAINNFAVASAHGEVVALVNNDVEVITPGWLDEMVGHACRPEIGCVGAMLYYPDDTVQHAGVVLGLGGLAGHGHKGLRRGDPGYVLRATCVHNVSAVTAACLVMRRSVYEDVGGFDEAGLAVAFNDVDLCLKVREKGLLNLWTPFAELYHHESVSRGSDHARGKVERFAREIDLMKRRWGAALLRDPYYSPNLTHSGEDYAIRN